MSRSHTTTAINKTGSWRFMRPAYHEKSAPCATACPVGTDIAKIQMLTADGDFVQAGQKLLQENPFPAICGHVCFHPCEAACHRAGYDQAVAINRIERFIGRHLIKTGARYPCAGRGPGARKVAIVGAGPAGLAAAYFLKILGIACEVFEAQDEPGGLLRWGIPDYRLPLDVLRAEVGRLVQMGIPIHCSRPVDQALVIELHNRYDAVFVGCGHGQPVTLPVKGAGDVVQGLAFLKKLRTKASDALQGRAAVIGGGNSAVDVARSLVRSGVETLIIYRRRMADMPAFEEEVERALAEGVVIKELLAPLQIERQGSGYLLKLQRMKLAEHGHQGQRATIVPHNGQRQDLRADHVYTAIGAEPDPLWRPPGGEAPESLHLTHCALQRDHQKVTVYGGDLTNPIRSVADAIASGKQAAMALNTYFTDGWEAVVPRLAACQIGRGQSPSMEIYTGGPRKARFNQTVAFEQLNLDYFRPVERMAVKQASSEAREPLLSVDAVQFEARRCFNCGLCNDCDNCRLFCPEIAVKITPAGRQIDLDYCKGCGICVTECPRDAMVLVMETP